MKLIYIAGPYSAPTIIECLDNMRRGMRLAHKVLKAGFSPFVPFFDFHFSLIGETTLEEYYQYSLDWLRVSEAVLLLPGWEKSKGTLNEIHVAKSLGIPIFESLWELLQANGETIQKASQ
jgi:hypothetical protein